MAVEIIMPKAGMAMEEGKIVRWLKEVGDTIEMGEGVMEIETDKITMENESPAAGVLLARYYEDGDIVPVTHVVGYVGKAGETVPEKPPTAAPNEAEAPSNTLASPPPMESMAPPLVPQQTSGFTLATPYAKTLAASAGVDISTIPGSGLGGVVKARDVQKATPLAARMAADRAIDLAAVKGTGHGGKVRSGDLAGIPASVDMARPLAGMRAVIAQRMSQSQTEIPTVTQSMKAYVDDLLALRARANEGRTDKITINDFIIKATAKAVAASDLFRTEIDTVNKQLITRARTNIAVAVSLDEGLMVPVIMDANHLSLPEISARAKDLAARARSGKLGADECQGSVITISNLGTVGVYTFTPIINQPNASILGVASMQEELALVDGEVQTRKYVMLCLTYDHRIIDGAEASKFQAGLKKLIENPVEILL
ncbi:MAG: 2-oxo acid dehydrogenase subunit E2 [Oscillospiraceae bacterium]|nr:2-oxo acid dehydrogenase subunit E2 [Oscillospiraceae bacterium]